MIILRRYKMTIPNDKKNQFIEYRACGFSIKSIADKIGISRQTLTKWEKQFENQINELEYLELEALKAEFKMSIRARINDLGSHLKKIRAELDKRDFSDIKTEKLLGMQLIYFQKFMDEISKFEYESAESMPVGTYLLKSERIPENTWDLKK